MADDDIKNWLEELNKRLFGSSSDSRAITLGDMKVGGNPGAVATKESLTSFANFTENAAETLKQTAGNGGGSSLGTTLAPTAAAVAVPAMMNRGNKGESAAKNNPNDVSAAPPAQQLEIEADLAKPLAQASAKNQQAYLATVQQEAKVAEIQAQMAPFDTLQKRIEASGVNKIAELEKNLATTQSKLSLYNDLKTNPDKLNDYINTNRGNLGVNLDAYTNKTTGKVSIPENVRQNVLKDHVDSQLKQLELEKANFTKDLSKLQTSREHITTDLRKTLGASGNENFDSLVQKLDDKVYAKQSELDAANIEYANLNAKHKVTKAELENLHEQKNVSLTEAKAKDIQNYQAEQKRLKLEAEVNGKNKSMHRAGYMKAGAGAAGSGFSVWQLFGSVSDMAKLGKATAKKAAIGAASVPLLWGSLWLFSNGVKDILSTNVVTSAGTTLTLVPGKMVESKFASELFDKGLVNKEGFYKAGAGKILNFLKSWKGTATIAGLTILLGILSGLRKQRKANEAEKPLFKAMPLLSTAAVGVGALLAINSVTEMNRYGLLDTSIKTEYVKPLSTSTTDEVLNKSKLSIETADGTFNEVGAVGENFDKYGSVYYKNFESGAKVVYVTECDPRTGQCDKRKGQDYVRVLSTLPGMRVGNAKPGEAYIEMMKDGDMDPRFFQSVNDGNAYTRAAPGIGGQNGMETMFSGLGTNKK